MNRCKYQRVNLSLIPIGIDVLENIVLKGCNTKMKPKLMFLIGLDCSMRPDQIMESFLNWLGYVYKLAFSLHTGEVKGGEKLLDLLTNIDAQLCVTVCKADFIQSGDLGAMKSFKNLQGSLRSICLEHGAALIYTSAKADLNCIKLQKYILHALYKDEIKVNLRVEIEEGIGTAFVPTRLDSPERILAATGVKLDDVIERYIETSPISLFEKLKLNDSNGEKDKDNTNDSDETIKGIEQSMENEQLWLSRLKKFVALAEATSVDVTTGSANNANGSKSVSRSSSDITLNVATEKSSSNDKTTGNDKEVEKKKVVPTRRSTRNAANTGTGDPTDFFKNLLVEAKPKK